jgi:hypothetical protein
MSIHIGKVIYFILFELRRLRLLISMFGISQAFEPIICTILTSRFPYYYYYYKNKEYN